MSEYRIVVGGKEMTAEEYAAYERERVNQHPCPHCGAGVGEPCVTDPRKGEFPGTHNVRPQTEAKPAVGLVEFLLARLAEEEQAIEYASYGDAWMDEGSVPWVYSPDRLRAEIAAKRAIIGRHQLVRMRHMESTENEPARWWDADECGRDHDAWPCADLRNLAAVYRPDYPAEAWLP